jgi:uncharacterized cupin superfamily protein
MSRSGSAADVVPEAPLRRTEHGLVPEGEGWFVVNAREALWHEHDDFGSWTAFEGDARFKEIGVNIGVLAPGQPACMYHGEDVEENFLVLSGECLLLVEGQERKLRAWDFIHCPPWTEHVFVGAGDGPCAILALGGRYGDGTVYPVSELAQKHGASVEQETRDPKEAYARFARPRDVGYDGQLGGAS